MKVIQAESHREAIRLVASLIIEKVEANPKLVLGLATGATMIPVYQELSLFFQQKKISFKDCHFFLLDEYLDLPPSHASTFEHYIKKHVILPLALREAQFSFPPISLDSGGDFYEKRIQDKGGIDLQLLGLGKNGHVGFNEPGSLKSSRTRIVELTKETLEANKNQFTDLTPRRAITMGISTILEAKELLMLVTGKAKAEVVRYFLSHHDESCCPATYLKSHPHFKLVLDDEASSKINLNI